MRISFDLDDTLICYQPGALHEPNRVPLLLRWWLHEPLRLGAAELLRDLGAAGHELWVYTTSFRHPRTVRWWLRCYGARVARVITQYEHESYFGRRSPSKNPAAFLIDLHIDDSWGVWLEGRQHHFRVLAVQPDDLAWAVKVRDAVARIMAGQLPPHPTYLPEEYAHFAE